MEDLSALLVEQMRLLTKLDSDFAMIKSIPAEAQRQIALDEIRKDFQDYDKTMQELQNMHGNTNMEFTGLLTRGKDQIKATIEEQKGGSEALATPSKPIQTTVGQQKSGSEALATTGSKLETLHRKTVLDYMQDSLVPKLDALLQERPAMTVTELRQNPLVLTDNLRLNQKAIARVTSSRKKFLPTKIIALNVIIEDYSELRRLKDFRGFKDLKLLRYDREKFDAGLTCIGVTDRRYLTNPSFMEFQKTINDLMKECRANGKKGERTFVLFQYGGHGLQDNFVFAMCNTIERKKVAFPLEKKIRDLAEIEGTFVVALFDCCREKMTVDEVQKGKMVKVEGRGGGMMEEEPDWSVAKARDLMIAFGCPPNSYTPAESTLTVGFFQTMDAMADKEDQVVVFPGNSTAWKPCNKGEVLTFTHHDLVVTFAAELNPLCLKQTTFTKLNTRSKFISASAIAALRQKVHFKEEQILYNENGDNIVAIQPLTKRMELLQPYEPYEPYLVFRTCVLEDGLFQISDDANCRILLPDYKTRKFTVEQRASIPYKAAWAQSTLVALPGSRVMVMGIEWGSKKLNPWVYDIKANTWSVMVTPDGKTVPPIPTARFDVTGRRLQVRRPLGDTQMSLGTATFFRGKVYVFPSIARQEAAGLVCFDINAGSPTGEWDVIPVDQMHGQRPSLVPCSPTELAIVGGHSFGKPRNLCTIVNTVETKPRDPRHPVFLPLETRAVPYRSDKPVFTDNSINAFHISDSQAFQIHRVGGTYQLSEISVQGEVAVVDSIAPIATARSVARVLEEYDTAVSLKRAGISELNPNQQAAMDKFWRAWLAHKENDVTTGLLFNKHLTPGMYHAIRWQFCRQQEHHKSVDPLKPENELSTLAMCWSESKKILNCGAAQQPADLLEARLNACRAIDGRGSGFSWQAFKKVHTIVQIWYQARRAHHDEWVREMETVSR